MQKFKLLSTFFFLLPLFLAIYFKIWISVLVLLCVITLCLIYHSKNEKSLVNLDKILAWVLIIVNLYLCYLGEFRMPYFGIAILLVLISTYFMWFGKGKLGYNLSHGLWHLISSLITIFSILTFKG